MGKIPVTGLWKKDKNGRQYMSGKCRDNINVPIGTTFVVYMSDGKTSESQPDASLYAISDDVPAPADEQY